jgi:Tfp pilus assembly protein PilO
MKLSRPKTFYLIMLGAFALLAIATLGLETWGFITISDNKSTIEETEYRISKTGEQGELLDTMTQNYNKALTFEKYAAIALPDKKDASTLISDLNSLAASSGLKLVLVQANTYAKAKSVSLDPSMLQTTKGKNSRELPLSIEVTGTYNNYIDFVQKIENYQRLANITSIDIEKSQEKDAPPDQIDVKFNLTAYLK